MTGQTKSLTEIRDALAKHRTEWVCLGGSKSACMDRANTWDTAIATYRKHLLESAPESFSLLGSLEALREQLAALEIENAALKHLPDVGAAHYRSELKIHQAESETFVKEATAKLTAQSELLNEVLAYLDTYDCKCSVAEMMSGHLTDCDILERTRIQQKVIAALGNGGTE